MKKFLSLLLLLFPIQVYGDTVTAMWDASVSTNVTGYQLLYGNASGDYKVAIDVGNVTTKQVALAPGVYYFVARAYTIDGAISALSNEARVAIQSQPECVPPLGNRSIAIFVTNLLKTNGDVALSGMRLDFQLASPNSPITHVAVRTNGQDLESMDGIAPKGITRLGAMWFTVPATAGSYTLGVLASNAYGCTNEITTSRTIVVK